MNMAWPLALLLDLMNIKHAGVLDFASEILSFIFGNLDFASDTLGLALHWLRLSVGLICHRLLGPMCRQLLALCAVDH
jgi:hypothetical protein